MAVRNNNLVPNSDWDAEQLFDYDLNDTFDAVIFEGGKTGVGVAQNAYQTLQSNNIFDNKDFLAADEFITETGTNNTVKLFSEGKITNNQAPTDTTHDPNLLTNPELAFDENDSSYAEKANISSFTGYLGKTFTTAKTIKYLRFYAQYGGGSTNSGGSITVQTFDGTTWSDTSYTYTGGYSVTVKELIRLESEGVNIQGIRIKISFTGNIGNNFARWYSIEYGDATDSTNANFSIDNYMLNVSGGGGLDIIASATNITQSYGSFTNKYGLEITATETCVLKSLTKNSSVNATVAYLYSSTGTLIESVSFSGDIATFSEKSVLSTGSTYFVTVDAAGSSYNVYRDASPFDITNSSQITIVNGSTGTNTSDTNNLFNIVDVTTRKPIYENLNIVICNKNQINLKSSDKTLSIYTDYLSWNTGTGDNVTDTNNLIQEVDGTSTTSYDKKGIKIQLIEDSLLKTINLNSSSTATTFYIYDEGQNLLLTEEIISNSVTFNTPLFLEGGKIYYFVFSNGGSNYTQVWDDGGSGTNLFTHPTTYINFKVLAGVYNTFTEQTNRIYQIDSIVMETATTKTPITDITVDISDGVSSLTNQPINSAIDISSLSSGQLQLQFNLITNDTKFTPKLYGWGVYKQ